MSGAKAKYSSSDLSSAINNSTSWSDVCRKLGLMIAGGTISNLKKKALEIRADFSHFKGQSWQKGMNRYTSAAIAKQVEKLESPWEDVFKKDSHCSKNAQYRLRRLVRSGKKELRCECCGVVEWNDKPMVFELHHINRDHADNRECNLEILCPNCHAQEHIANVTSSFYELCKVI